MSSILRTTGDLIDVVYRRSGVDAPTRIDVIQDACERFGEVRLDRADPSRTAHAISGLSTLACRASLEVVSRGLRHDREHAAEVFISLGIVANLITDTPGIDLNQRDIIGANNELAVMGALWAGLAMNADKQPGHARFSTYAENRSNNTSALMNGFDILYTTPTKNLRQPHKTKLQVKATEPSYSETRTGTGKKIKRYENDIVMVPVDQIVPASQTPELSMLQSMASLDVDQMALYAARIDGMIRDHHLRSVNLAA